MTAFNKNEIRKAVRENYAKIGASESPGCGCSSPSCCPPSGTTPVQINTLELGYSGKDVISVPEGSNLGLGCGNPQAIAALKPGETVLDLGSGGGFDCFLAVKAVGPEGTVIGIDMTPEMVTRSSLNAEEAGLNNVHFRLGEMENLPVEDGIIDVIISNCVINLSPEKEKVFREAFRVLKPGGRLAISDVVVLTELPEDIKNDITYYTACVAGAASIKSLEEMLNRAGFKNIHIRPVEESRTFIREWMPGSRIEDYIASATIEAEKPKMQ